MPRVCSVCVHPDREAIDRALVDGADSYRRIATRFGLSESAVRRHKANHLPAALARAKGAEEMTQADDLLAQMGDLRRQAQVIKDKAEKAGDLRTALAGIRELVRIVELLAKLRGELDDRPVINVLVTPQWVQVRAVLLQALTPYPEARTAAAAALLEVAGDGGD